MKLDIDRYRQREELRKRVIEAFSSQDDVYRICFFGREAEGQHDRYSDIDLVVFSNDLAGTYARYKEIFSSISPLRASFPLGGVPEGYSEMVLLQDYSPYQKVDFSIGDWGKQDWKFLVVYESKEKARASQTRLKIKPIVRDAGYVLTDVLFSVARFTKCLFRRDIDMYRRWMSITDVTLALLYEKHFGWKHEMEQTRLGSYGSKQLCDDLSPDERSLVDNIRPPIGKLDIASSYQASVELLIELSKQKAEHFRIVLDYNLIEYIHRFMRGEMERYHEQLIDHQKYPLLERNQNATRKR
jgi:predicted nucleotidyltransferase